MGGAEERSNIAAMIQQLGAARADPSANGFNHRLDTLATMARVATDNVTPSAIHWAQSNQLFTLERFERMATIGFPGPVGAHPLLFGEAPEMGLRTFGARHWLGREILVPATVLPWEATYQSALDFIAFSTSKNGYVIPDGDTFSPQDSLENESENGGEIWRVHHREADSGKAANDDAGASGGPAPVYELVPQRLRHQDPAPRKTVDPAAPLREAASGKTSGLTELEAALTEGIAEATTATPSQPGETSLSGRSLRAQLFSNKAK